MVLASTMIWLTSCESYLEEENFSNVTAESYFSERTADELVAATYQQLRDVYKEYNAAFMGTDLYTSTNEIKSFNSLNDYVNITANLGESSSVWEDNYKVISRANTAINRYQNQISWSETNIETRDNGIAQAKCLRALAYYNLVQNFGGVPILLEEVSEIRYDYVRTTEEQVFTQIIADLEDALQHLEAEPKFGRFSIRAAQHLLADVYVSKAYKSYGSQLDFTTAAQYAESAIGGYDILSQTYENLFEYTNQENDEILLSVLYGDGIDYDDRNNDKHSICSNSVNDYNGIGRVNDYGRASTGFMPTQFFFSLYADNDVREAVTFHRVLYANEVSSYSSDNGSEEINPGDTVMYYPKHALSAEELADKLNRYWVYQPDQYYYGVPQNIAGTLYQYSSNANETNFPIFKKFDDVDFDESNGGRRDTYLFRVGGTHLIAAEAYLGAGDESNALNHINKVRQRATGETSYYSSGLSIDDILNERALELAGEENRWVILKRTGKLEERVNAYNPHVQDHGAFDASVHYLRPIPANERILSDGSLEQNPGY